MWSALESMLPEHQGLSHLVQWGKATLSGLMVQQSREVELFDINYQVRVRDTKSRETNGKYVHIFQIDSLWKAFWEWPNLRQFWISLSGENSYYKLQKSSYDLDLSMQVLGWPYSLFIYIYTHTHIHIFYMCLHNVKTFTPW